MRKFLELNKELFENVHFSRLSFLQRMKARYLHHKTIYQYSMLNFFFFQVGNYTLNIKHFLKIKLHRSQLYTENKVRIH